MKNINDGVFLNKINQRIKNGDFDVHFTIPFMTRDLFFSSIKGRINKRIISNGTPILSDIEIEDCIKETKETAINIIALYIKLGFIIRVGTGFQFTEKLYHMIKVAYNN